MMISETKLKSWLVDALSSEKALSEILEIILQSPDNSQEMIMSSKKLLYLSKSHQIQVSNILKRMHVNLKQEKSSLDGLYQCVLKIANQSQENLEVEQQILSFMIAHLQLALYQTIISAALHLGDQETAEIVREIYQETERYEWFYFKNLPIQVQVDLDQEMEQKHNLI